MTTSDSREVQVWREQYFQALRRFAASGMTNTGQVDAMATALRSLLERAPNESEQVLRLSAQACLMTRRSGAPEQVAAIAQIGLEAESLDPTAAAGQSAGAILLLCVAEAELAAERRLPGLDVLRRLEKRLTAHTQPLAGWIWARERFLRASLHEIGLERGEAHRRYLEAARESDDILDVASRRTAFVDEWLATSFQGVAQLDDTQGNGFGQVALLELRMLHTGAVIGAARTLPSDAPRAERAEAVRLAWSALRAHPAAPDLDIYDFVPLVGALPEAEAVDFADWLASHMPGAAASLLNQGITDGITDPEARALIDAFRNRTVSEPVTTAWRLAGDLGVAIAVDADGNADRAERLRIEAVMAAMRSRLALPQAMALAVDLEARHAHAAADDDLAKTAELFLLVLGGTIEGDPSVFESPQKFALFENAIEIAIEVALRRLTRDDSVANRRLASVAIDLSRSRSSPPPGALTAAVARDDDSSAGLGLLEATDTLGRITAAIDRHPDAAVLVLQKVTGGTAFLLLGPHERRPRLEVDADGHFATAVANLADAAYDAMFAYQFDAAAGADSVAAAGRHAYEALPQAVRDTLRAAEVLLIVPDYRSETDEIPFELLRDQQGYLGEAKILARFVSLRHLARELDTRNDASRRRRALVTAVSESLPSAEEEREEVARTLASAGWDAPEIRQERLSADFFAERLSHVDVLHIASHGEATAGSESLLLLGGERLVVDDLVRRPQRSMPMVFLNTCELGQTRYLGAGLSRGMAYTFAELGSPAVIANPVEVFDEATSDLARAFYLHALSLPVGAALRTARQDLSGGFPAAVWGRAMLFGDPWHRLPGLAAEEPDSDLAAVLLDAYFTTTPTEEDQADAFLAVQRSLLTAGDQPRLAAALHLVQSVASLGSELDDEGRAELFRAIVLADALDHLPAIALTRLIAADDAELGGADVAVERLEDAAPALAALAEFDEGFRQLLSTTRGKARRMRLKERGLEPRSLGPSDGAIDDEMNAFLEVLFGAEAEVEEERGSAKLRDRERTAEDIAWNAVVMGHPNRFEDAREVAQFCGIVADKLVRVGALNAETLPWSAPALMGLLRFLWSTQKTTLLEREMAEGQAGTVLAMVNDLNAHWSPPPRREWLQPVLSFPKDLDKALKRIDELDYWHVYDELDLLLNGVQDRALELLDEIQRTHPEALPACATYVTGTIVERDVFSPLDGSVPEDIDERLTRILWELNGGNEGRFMPWLMTGFEQVRTREPDELERWRMEWVQAEPQPPGDIATPPR